MDDLKECPFCGGSKEDISIRYKEVKGRNKTFNGFTYIYIECLPCGARTEDCFEADANICGFKSAKHMAIFKWNLRGGENMNTNQDIQREMLVDSAVNYLQDMIAKLKEISCYNCKKNLSPVCEMTAEDDSEDDVVDCKYFKRSKVSTDLFEEYTNRLCRIRKGYGK